MHSSFVEPSTDARAVQGVVSLLECSIKIKDVDRRIAVALRNGNNEVETRLQCERQHLINRGRQLLEQKAADHALSAPVHYDTDKKQQ